MASKDLKAQSETDFTVEYPAKQMAFVGGEPQYGADGHKRQIFLEENATLLQVLVSMGKDISVLGV
ncbi:hypothetical protein BKI52_43400 [marine bacterium AO1-C]|nr:hypothetical protein BKI52_43400 [marine bacterium AO1-C]